VYAINTLNETIYFIALRKYDPPNWIIVETIVEGGGANNVLKSSGGKSNETELNLGGMRFKNIRNVSHNYNKFRHYIKLSICY